MFSTPHTQIGEIFLERKIISSEQLKLALERQRNRGGLLCQILLEMGFISEEDIAVALTQQFHLPYLPLERYQIDEWVIRMIPKEIAKTHLLIPLDRFGKTLTIAVADPTDTKVLRIIEETTQCQVQVFVSTPSRIRTLIEQYYTEETPPDRRRFPRLTRDVSLLLIDENGIYRVQTKDISGSGLSCILDRYIRLMSRVEVRLMLPNGSEPEKVQCWGTVVRIDPIEKPDEGCKYKVAIFLSELADPDREKIVHYLERNWPGSCAA